MDNDFYVSFHKLRKVLLEKGFYPVFIKHACKEAAVDAVEVVRCKDCKNYKNYYGDSFCPMVFIEQWERDDDGYTETEDIIHDLAFDEGFCAFGERRTDE